MKTRVAVVDDDPALLSQISELLAGQGWEVVTACEGAEALLLLKEEQPDLLILNLWLETPVSGWALLRLLKEETTTRSIPVIVYSGGSAQFGNKDAWLSEHGIAILPKPFTNDDLFHRVERMLSLQAASTGRAMLSVARGSDILLPKQAVAGEVQELSIQLLGGFNVSVGSTLIDEAAWSLRKAKSLVKLLALTPQHRLHREQVMDLLWPGFGPEAIANNFHITLHVARHALEPTLPPRTPSSYLRLQGEFLSLDRIAHLGIDIEAFQAAADSAWQAQDPATYEAALNLYGGELLPEDRNEDWTISYRERLTAIWCRLLMGLAHLWERRGEIDLGIAALRQIVASNPAHDEAQAALMRLLAQAGSPHQALRQYRQLRNALRRELNIEPEPATQLLYQQIHHGQIPPNTPKV